ncbi:MAG: hypothetical protein R3B06_26530 [Kofleriaceae bacterium]
MKRYVVVLAIGLVACGGRSKPADTTALTLQGHQEPAPAEAAPPEPAAPPAADPALTQKLEQALAFFVAMGDVATAAGDDCPKAAAGLAALLEDNRALMIEAKHWSEDPATKDQAEAWMQAHQAQMMTPMMKVATLNQTCSSDPDFAAVMARLGADPEDEPAPPPPFTPAFEATMQQAIRLFVAMGNAADSAAGDCSKAGKALSKVFDDNAAFMAKAKTWDKDPAFRDQADAWMKLHMDEIMAPMMKVGTLGQKCGTDPDFANAMKRLDDEPGK